MCMCGCARDMLCACVIVHEDVICACLDVLYACVDVHEDVLCVYVCRVQGRACYVLIFHSLPYSLLLMLFYFEIDLTL